jgi:uncharacterized membrane protein YfcA
VTLGIARYGPTLVLFSLNGMEPRAALPIMVGSGAFMGLVAAMRFVRSGRYAAPAALGLTFGGIPGVLIAVWLVRSLPLDVVLGRHRRGALHGRDTAPFRSRRAARAGVPADV